MPDRMTGTYEVQVVIFFLPIKILGHRRKQLVSVMCLTLVSAKQVYNGKVKLFNKNEPFRL